MQHTHHPSDTSIPDVLKAFIQTGPHLEQLFPFGVQLIVSTPGQVVYQTSTLEEAQDNLHTVVIQLYHADGQPVGSVQLTTNVSESSAYEQSKQAQEGQLRALWTMNVSLSQAQDLDTVMETALHTTLDLIGTDDKDMGIIFSLDQDTGTLVARHHYNMHPDFVADLERHPIHLGEGIAGRVALTGTPELVEDLDQEPQNLSRPVTQQQANRSLLCIPITFQGRTLGILSLGSRRRNRFGEQEIEMLASLGAQDIGNAVQRIQRLEQARHTLEQKRHIQAQQIRHAEIKAVQNLAAGLGHEMNNPLTTVIGFSQFLQETVSDLALQTDLKLIEQKAQDCADVISRIIDITQHRAVVCTYKNVNDTLKNALTLAQMRANDQELILSLNLAENLPLTMFDEGQMEQAIGYLFDKARRAPSQAHSGPIQVRSTVVKRDPQLAIRIEFILDTAQRTGKLDSTSYDIELGLLVAQQIIKAHNGELWLANDVQQPVWATIELPIVTPEIQAIPQPEQHAGKTVVPERLQPQHPAQSPDF